MAAASAASSPAYSSQTVLPMHGANRFSANMTPCVVCYHTCCVRRALDDHQRWKEPTTLTDAQSSAKLSTLHTPAVIAGKALVTNCGRARGWHSASPTQFVYSRGPQPPLPTNYNTCSALPCYSARNNCRPSFACTHIRNQAIKTKTPRYEHIMLNQF